MAIVECINVNKTYYQGNVKVEALKNVNLSIDKGGFVALAGPGHYRNNDRSLQCTC